MAEEARLHVLLVAGRVASAWEAALREAGMQVAVTSHAREALAMARAARPDAVVLSIDAPRLGAYRACAALKRRRVLSGIPVLLAGAGESESRAALQLRHGPDVFLSAPLDAHALPGAVVRAVAAGAAPVAPMFGTGRVVRVTGLAGLFFLVPFLVIGPFVPAWARIAGGVLLTISGTLQATRKSRPWWMRAGGAIVAAIGMGILSSALFPLP